MNTCLLVCLLLRKLFAETCLSLLDDSFESLSSQGSLTSDVVVSNGIAQLLVDLLGAIDHRDKFTTLVALVDLARAHNLILRVLNELVPMGKPAGQARKSEHDGEHLSGNAEGLVDHTRVEVNVRVELPLDEVLVREGDPLELHGNVDHGFAANNSEHIVGELAHKASPRVEVLVDAMAEAHEHLLAILHVLDELGDVLYIANLVQHAKHCLICTTVAWAVKSSHGTGKGCVDIGLRTRHVTNSGC